MMQYPSLKDVNSSSPLPLGEGRVRGKVSPFAASLKKAALMLLSPVLAFAAATSLPTTPQGTIQSAQTFPANVSVPAAPTASPEPATPSTTVSIAPPADPNAPNPYVEATQPVTQLVDPAVLGTSEDPAFKNMTNKIFPMSPEQIQLLYGIQDTTQRAIAGADTTPPRPVVSTQPIVLAPGAVPPVIRLGTGYVSSIVFIDQTGAPWPLAAYNIGDPGRFNIQWDKESNVMMIQSQSSYATGNMAVQLKGLDTPVMLTLVSDQRVVDYRLDFRVQGRGPNANTALISGTLPAGNGNMMLMNLLDGVAPAQAKNLQVEGGVAQAWMVEGDLLIRTPLTLLSPSWKATMSSPDGTKVYQLNPTSFVLASEQGRSVTLKIMGL